MATLIADTACVDPRAELADDVEIGPYCVIGPDVKIGRGTRLIAHVCILGVTTLGEHNVVYPFAVLGGDPQDVSYQGAATRVEIGDHNLIRESVTINRGSREGRRPDPDRQPQLPDGRRARRARLQARRPHHDRQRVALAGHVHVESHANISGGVAVHHYVTIGGYSFIGGQSRIVHDVPRFMLVDGNPSRVRCINIVGLKRNGISAAGIESLHEAHRLVFRAKMSVRHAAEILESHGHMTPEIQSLLEFLRSQQEGKHGRGRERWRKS